MIRILPIAVVLCLLSACSRSAEESSVAEKPVNPAAELSPPSPPPKVELTAEEREVLEMNDCLDDGKTGIALRHARNLMDSKSAAIRSVETLQWIGSRALPEITELINDSNEQVAGEAMDAWKIAFAEIDGDWHKTTALVESVVKLTRYEDIIALLEQAEDIEPRAILPALEKLINENRGKALGECALECYKSISDGEIPAEGAKK